MRKIASNNGKTSKYDLVVLFFILWIKSAKMHKVGVSPNYRTFQLRPMIPDSNTNMDQFDCYLFD